MSELILALLEGALEYILFSGDCILRPRRKERLSLRERLDRAKVRRRNRAIRRWVKKGKKLGPIPNIGLKCATCDYSLTGLTVETCPECGSLFDIEAMIDPSADRHRTRRRRKKRD